MHATGSIADEPKLVYPKTRQSDHVDVYHDTKVPDPYRWLETVEQPEELAHGFVVGTDVQAETPRRWFVAERSQGGPQRGGGDVAGGEARKHQHTSPGSARRCGQPRRRDQERAELRRDQQIGLDRAAGRGERQAATTAVSSPPGANSRPKVTCPTARTLRLIASRAA